MELGLFSIIHYRSSPVLGQSSARIKVTDRNLEEEKSGSLPPSRSLRPACLVSPDHQRRIRKATYDSGCTEVPPVAQLERKLDAPICCSSLCVGAGRRRSDAGECTTVAPLGRVLTRAWATGSTNCCSCSRRIPPLYSPRPSSIQASSRRCTACPTSPRCNMSSSPSVGAPTPRRPSPPSAPSSQRA